MISDQNAAIVVCVLGKKQRRVIPETSERREKRARGDSGE